MYCIFNDADVSNFLPPDSTLNLEDALNTLTTKSIPNYVPRDCDEVSDSVEKGRSPVFIGPKSCGKSSTLREVYIEMKTHVASGGNVAFIDVNTIGEETQRALSTLTQQTFY